MLLQYVGTKGKLNPKSFIVFFCSDDKGYSASIETLVPSNHIRDGAISPLEVTKYGKT